MNQRTKDYHVGMMMTAIQMGQSEYEADGLTVGLPAPQTAGTYMQRLTYARQKAQAIIENL
jgi:hypothetical protein